LPIYEANYVRGGFRTGAIMGVPAHDDNDKTFADRFNISSKTILQIKEDKSTTLINSGKYTNMKLEKARQ
jgi:leucyl-tRNA synthetase